MATLHLYSARDPFSKTWAACVAEEPGSEYLALARGEVSFRAPIAAPDNAAEVLVPRELVAFDMLVATLERPFAASLADVLAEHVLTIHLNDAFEVQRAAAEEIVERGKARRREELRVATRPPGGHPFGVYRTRGPGRGAVQPFETWLVSWSPLRASCDCPDFLENGLGVCGHVLAALTDVVSRPACMRRIPRARVVEPSLDWDPVRPLLGADVPWERLRAVEAAGAFAKTWHADADGSWRPRTAATLGSARRFARRQPAHVTPAARAVIETAVRRDDDRKDRESSLDATLKELETLRRPLYGYQREGVARFLAAGRLLLADDMGLGKTAQAIAACHALAQRGRVRRGLVVVPAPLKYQWAREWRAFSPVPVRVVEGRPEVRRALYAASADEGFLVINYELLLRDADALCEWAPDLVVIDEAQRIKNPQTKTAQAVKRIPARLRLALTGTPLENRLEELSSIMEWVDEAALAPRWRLGPVHGGVHDGGVRGLATIRARLAGTLLRRRRGEILSQLPARTDTYTTVEITAVQADEHRALSRPIAQLVRTSKRRPLSPPERLRLISLLTKQRIIANGWAQEHFEEVWPCIAHSAPSREVLRDLFTPKLEQLRALLRAFVIEQGRTVVVFSQWRRMLKLVEWATRDILGGAGLRAVFFTGRESSRARDRNIVELHDDPQTRVLFATDCASVGLNLQRAATACINVELPWNPAILEQRIARLHRLGQRSPIDVVALTTEASIEMRIASVIGAKQAIFEGLFDTELDSIEFAQRSAYWDPSDERVKAAA